MLRAEGLAFPFIVKPPQDFSLALRIRVRGSRRQQEVSLAVAGNGSNIFSNGLSGYSEISNSGHMSPFPLLKSVVLGTVISFEQSRDFESAFTLRPNCKYRKYREISPTLIIKFRKLRKRRV